SYSSVTYVALPAAKPDKVINAETMMMAISGAVQLSFKSKNKPMNSGPTAANTYPMDCAMPDKVLACWAFRARIPSMASDKLMDPAEANPMIVPHIKMSGNGPPNRSPIKPMDAP